MTQSVLTLTPIAPFLVEAVQFQVLNRIPCKHGVAIETNSGAIASFCGQPVHFPTIPDGTPQGMITAQIPTLHGNATCLIDDYVCRDSAGNLWVMKERELLSYYHMEKKA